MRDSYLFSPGPVPKKEEIEINFSHRDKEFSDLMVEVKSLLLEMAPEYNDVILTQGSASSAIETVFSSLFGKKDKVLILANGAFGNRAASMADYYSNDVEVVNTEEGAMERLSEGDIKYFFAVQFETSLSLYNDLTDHIIFCKNNGVVSIIDAVSAFPFTKVGKPDFLITSSAKQLGGIPVMGVIFYDVNKEYELKETTDYLSFKKYKQYSLKNQTPHTSLIPQILSLKKSLEDLFSTQIARINFRSAIIANSKDLTEGLEDCILNSPIAPVITFKVKDTKSVVQYLHSKGIKTYFNLFYMKDYIQVSTFNYLESEVPYRELNEVLRGLKEKGLL